MSQGYYTHHIICKQCGKEIIRQSKQKIPQKYCSIQCKGKDSRASEDLKYQRAVLAYEKDVIKKEGCWGWNGCFSRKGYGIISGSAIFNTRIAHRISWIIYNGKIPDGLHILHSCQNKFCTNPEHLRLGTNADNVLDKIKDKTLSSILTESQVIEIKKFLKENISHQKIAKMYGVGRKCISAISLRKSWKHLQE